jgi:hypothetical protein
MFKKLMSKYKQENNIEFLTLTPPRTPKTQRFIPALICDEKKRGRGRPRKSEVKERDEIY